MSRKLDPSDISREQFEVVKDLQESAKKKTCPREVDLYDIFFAILYLLREGCRWRTWPGDFPPRGTVRYYFDQWSACGANEEASATGELWRRRATPQCARQTWNKSGTYFGLVPNAH